MNKYYVSYGFFVSADNPKGAMMKTEFRLVNALGEDAVKKLIKVADKRCIDTVSSFGVKT